jgi:DNA-binding response OmpR family regulator
MLQDQSLEGSENVASVLIVDDEEGVRRTMGAFLEQDGHKVFLACDASAALDLLAEETFDVVMTDIILPKKSGVELLGDIQHIQPQAQVILITGEPEVEAAASALRMGAFDYLAKPLSRVDITSTVTAAAKSSALSGLQQDQGETSQRYRDSLDAQVSLQIDRLRRMQRTSDRFLRHEVLINRLAIALENSANLPALYRIVQEHVKQVMDTAMFIISSYDSESQLIQALFVVNDGEEMQSELLPPIPLAKEGRGRQSQVIRTGLPLVMASKSETAGRSDTEYTITSDGDVKEGVATEGEDVVRSAIFVPMMIDGQTIGVVQVQSYRGNAYVVEDVSLLSGMANIAAVAIANAQQ